MKNFITHDSSSKNIFGNFMLAIDTVSNWKHCDFNTKQAD